MSDKPELTAKLPDKDRVTREDFELACIREFSHSGCHLGDGVSRGERRQRIRAAILRENKAHSRWQYSGLTYAEVYEQVYKESLGADGNKDGRAKGVAAWRLNAGDNFDEDEEPIDVLGAILPHR